MAVLIAEQIIAQLETTVKGLTTTKQNVRVNPVYDQEPDNIPGLDIFQGDDTNISETGALNISQVINELTVTFRAYIKKNNNYVTQLNLIRKELHVALMADYTQGGLVRMTVPQGAGAPTLDFGDKPISTMDIAFVFQYQHSVLDPSI